MSSLNEIEQLKIHVHNLKLALKRKNEQVDKLKEIHTAELKKVKKEYANKLLNLRVTLSSKKIRKDSTINILCDILNYVTGVSEKDILSGSRKRDYIVPRYIICHILRMEGKTLQFIAKTISNKHHSTVIHAINVVEDWLTYPDYYKKELEVYNKTKNMFDDIKN